KLDKPLEDLKALDKEFATSTEELERAALANLKQEIRTLETQLATAAGETREQDRRNSDVITGLVKQKEQAITRFDHLAVTALREHLKDDELSIVFRILNRELLELPVGKDGIAVTRQDQLLAALRRLL